MALVDLNSDQSTVIRPGDIVFHVDLSDADYPLHVGIYIGLQQTVSSESQSLRVRGLPAHPIHAKKYLGDAVWDAEYATHFIGQRKDIDAVLVKEAVHISARQLLERSQIYAACKWAKPEEVELGPLVGDGVPMFLRGTCGQFVEFVYEIAGLELHASKPEAVGSWPWKVTYNPERPKRIYPTTQAHIFRTGSYGLSTAWDPRYGTYPDCLGFGTRTYSR